MGVESFYPHPFVSNQGLVSFYSVDDALVAYSKASQHQKSIEFVDPNEALIVFEAELESSEVVISHLSLDLSFKVLFLSVTETHEAHF